MFECVLFLHLNTGLVSSAFRDLGFCGAYQNTSSTPQRLDRGRHIWSLSQLVLRGFRLTLNPEPEILTLNYPKPEALNPKS